MMYMVDRLNTSYLYSALPTGGYLRYCQRLFLTPSTTADTCVPAARFSPLFQIPNNAISVPY